MKILIGILEAAVLLCLLVLLFNGLAAGDLKLIVPTLVVLLTLSPIIALNYANSVIQGGPPERNRTRSALMNRSTRPRKRRS